MSKTFESSRPTGTLLRVEPIEIFNEAHLTIVLPSREEDICIAPSDAPALALAILEAAGYSEESHGLMEYVVGNLREVIRDEVERTAEAKEQAELEAEALELLNTEREYIGADPVRDLSEVHAVAREAAIAVARRARELAEMRAEK